MSPAKPKCLLFLLGRTNTFIKHSGVFFRRSRPEVFCEKNVSCKFHKIHRKTSVPESLFFFFCQGLQLWHKCFPVNFVKFLRTLFSQMAASDSYRGSYFITRGKKIWFDFSRCGYFTSWGRSWINFSTGDNVIGIIFPEVGISLRHWYRGLYQVMELVGSLVSGLLTRFYLLYLHSGY